MKIVSIDEYVSEAVPENLDWKKNLSLKDRVVVTGIRVNEPDYQEK